MMKFISYFLLCLLFTGLLLTGCDSERNTPVKVGILHSMTGTMAMSEKPVIDATLLAIEEINASGGVLGRKLQPIIVDGKSDWPSFANGAEQLINEKQVEVIFGAWTSASRKVIKPIIERHDHLLFYPVQYEGLESSPNIVYLGAVPNQQITPVVQWSVEQFGKRVFLMGSDYVFPRAAHVIIKAQLNALGAQVVGESYLPLGSHNVGKVIQKIDSSGADIIFNTINGDSNLAFFKQLSVKKIKTPVMSFSLSETELQEIEPRFMQGNYAAWSYFQSIETQENKEFVAKFKQKYGQDRSINDPMVAAYVGVHLWAKAASDAKSVKPTAVRLAIKGQSLNSPKGKVIVSSMNNHLWQPLRIAKIQENQQFKIIFHDAELIRPLPYPMYKSKQAWQKFLYQLYRKWEGSWSAPVQNTRGVS